MNADDLIAERARIEQVATGYMLSEILFAAADLGLYDHLADGPSDLTTLARRVGAPASALARLCTALVALGLLRKDPDGRFSAAATTLRLLARGGEDSLSPFLLHHRRHIAPLLSRLTQAVCQARPQHADWSFALPDAADRHCYAELSRHPDEYRVFLEVMDRTSAGVGYDIARAVPLGELRTLIDLGGGGGQVARELLAAAPSLTVELMDTPEAIRMAEGKAAGAGFSSRFRATAADFTRPLPVSDTRALADAVLLSAVLADWGPGERCQILANAAALLRPGGLLLVGETLLDEERTGPLSAALLSLVMLVAMPGDSFTLGELRALIRSAGFDVVGHHSHRAARRRDLVVCRRVGADQSR
jgi:SAM-dependent methyltransferase